MEEYFIKIGYMKPSSILKDSWREVQPEYSNEMELDCENPKVRVHDNSSITEIFGLFFSNEVLQDILKYTNLAFRNKRQKERISERDKKWYDLSEDELLKYISIIIFMGIAKLPEYNLHWSTKTHFQSNLIKEAMSINRFKAIGRYLAIGSNIKGNKLSRIQALSDKIQQASLQYYVPCKNLSIDESMIGFTGKHELKQYMPMNPANGASKLFSYVNQQLDIA